VDLSGTDIEEIIYCSIPKFWNILHVSD